MNFHMLYLLLPAKDSINLSTSSSIGVVQEIADIIQVLLNGTGGVVEGVAGQDELVAAAQTETNVSRLFGCLLNGSGTK